MKLLQVAKQRKVEEEMQLKYATVCTGMEYY